MKNIFLLSLFISLVSIHITAKAQEQRTLYDFRIIRGTMNEVDVTKWLLDAEMHTVFYRTLEDSALMLANVSYNTDTQSYGTITLTREIEYGETEEGDPVTTYYQDWSFANNYDDETGIAKVKAIFTFKPDATYLTLYIVPNDLRVLIYHGIAEGQPDL
jgi:hypothetical protein